MSKLLVAAVLLGQGLLATGCSSSTSSEPILTHPVRGQVLVNGRTAAGAIVKFYATGGDAVNCVPHAVTGADGSFVLTTYKPDDGAPAGQYQVSVVWKVNPDGTPVPPEDDESPVADRLKDRYSDPMRSKLTATVVAGENNLAPFRLN
jgi:hypothetical protein